MNNNNAQGYEIVENILDISPVEWNLCSDSENAFIKYEFFHALETSHSACFETGWKPHHLIKRNEEEEIIGICPLYLKFHSFGEYIFDHAWANAYERFGLNYYPKLLSLIHI